MLGWVREAPASLILPSTHAVASATPAQMPAQMHIGRLARTLVLPRVNASHPVEGDRDVRL
jgi:hypothetical protein